MITIFNREEVYAGLSMEMFAKIRDILSANQIKYTYKVVNLNGDDSRKYGTASGIAFTYEYYLYVHKKDFEEACYLMNKSI